VADRRHLPAAHHYGHSVGRAKRHPSSRSSTVRWAGEVGTSPVQVERINYDANLNGRLNREGTAATTIMPWTTTARSPLWTAAPRRHYQIGHIYGSVA